TTIFDNAHNNTNDNVTLSETVSGDDEIEDNPMQNPFLFQGDIMLTEKQMKNVIAELQDQIDNQTDIANHVVQNQTDVGDFVTREKRSILSVIDYPWQFPIKYFLPSDYSNAEKNVIDRALTEIEDNTCIRFEEQDREISGTPGINVIASKSRGLCWSHIGQHFPNAPQTLILGNACLINSIIQHEFGHALGLYHEQSRPDRDNYLNIHDENIIDSMKSQFVKSTANSVKDYGVKFDFGSTMLYGDDFASKNEKKTMTPKDEIYSEDLGQQERFSFSDYKILNFHYCNTTCSTQITCSNGGYQNPNSCQQCLCPNGFSGPSCQYVNRTTSNCGNIHLTATTAIQTLTQSGAKNCHYAITTDPNHKIGIFVYDLKITNATYKFPCSVGKGLEIKFGKDMTNSGAAFCGSLLTTPSTPKLMISASNIVMVHYPGAAATHTFSLKYFRL
uniref:Zinc metalloproteinase n=1 Tax=Rhabditophanes sp. KR3021 TaxID=114890 RepID=A0AC35UEL7_9BILA